MDIKKVTIIGANGTMGSNIAGIFASFGNAKVYMISRTIEKSEIAIEKAVKSVRADAIRGNLIAKDYSELEECVTDSDIIFESVAEDFEIKKDVLSRISAYVKDEAIICTGTSGLSINKMCDLLPEHLRKRYLGVHFFNPPYNMTLCEMIPADSTSDSLIKELKKYAEEQLLRTVIVLKDYSAFMGNRIGFFFINKAIRYAEEYKDYGGIDFIDAIFGGFTGRNMPPIRTADFVGLDIHKAIVDNVLNNVKDGHSESFILPNYVERLIRENKFGRKIGEGLYKTVVTEDGQKSHYVYDITTGEYRKMRKYEFSFAKDMILCLEEGRYKDAKNVLLQSQELSADICRKLLFEYVLYALEANKEVGYSEYDADDAMATGFSWIPPLAVIAWFGGAEVFEQLCQNVLEPDVLEKYHLTNDLSELVESKYEYEKFLKARG